MEHFKKLCFRSNTDTHREQFRCILLHVYSKRRAVQELDFARTKVHQKLKQKHAFYLENTKIVQSVYTEVLHVFVLDSKKTQVENVFPVEISVFSAAAVIRYRKTHETNCWLWGPVNVPFLEQLVTGSIAGRDIPKSLKMILSCS